jgi:hypothetical protein
VETLDLAAETAAQCPRDFDPETFDEFIAAHPELGQSDVPRHPEVFGLLTRPG